MVQTQIQLTERQAAGLMRLAAERGVSMAELVRRSVDDLLARSEHPDPADLRSELENLFGTFSSGVEDLGRSHDAYFVESVTGRAEGEYPCWPPPGGTPSGSAPR